MTTTSLPRPAHTVRVPEAQRQHRRAVVRWALEGGHPLHRDALAALLDHHAGRHGGGSRYPDGPAVVLRWTCADVVAAAGPDLTGRWCAERHALAPPVVLPTLSTYLDHLGQLRLLARGSDPLASMRAVLRDLAAERPPTRRLGHPSGRGRLLTLPRRG